MPIPKILNVYDVAEITGLNVNTVRIKARSGEIKGFFKLGRDWKIKESDLMDFIEELKKEQLKK